MADEKDLIEQKFDEQQEAQVWQPVMLGAVC